MITEVQAKTLAEYEKTNEYIQKLKSEEDGKTANQLFRTLSLTTHPDKAPAGATDEEKAQRERDFKCLGDAKQIVDNEKAGELSKFNEKWAMARQEAGQPPRPTPTATPSAKTSTKAPDTSMDVNNVPESMRQAVVLRSEPLAELGDGNEARQRLIEALQRNFGKENSFGQYNSSKYNGSGYGSTHICGNGNVSFNEQMRDGQPVTAIGVNPQLYTGADGKIDSQKRDDLHAEAAARFLISQAEAKYPEGPDKGLSELAEKTKHWVDYSSGTSLDKMDELTTHKIQELLLDRKNELEAPPANPAIENAADNPAIENTANKPAIENGADTSTTQNKQASGPVDAKRKALATTLAKDAKEIGSHSPNNTKSTAPTPLSTTPSPNKAGGS